MPNFADYNTTDALNNTVSPNGAPEGMPAGKLNDSMRALMGAAARFAEDSKGALITGGSGDAYTLTTSSAYSNLADLPLLVFRIDRANGGPATLNVDSLGAKAIRQNGIALAAGYFAVNTILAVAYNATVDAFDIVNALAPTSIPDSALSSNIPRLDALNTFTAGTLSLEASSPAIQLIEEDAGTDEKRWNISANLDQLFIGTRDDSGTYIDSVLRASRSGANITTTRLDGTTILFNEGPLPVNFGGTGATNATAARENLGLRIGTDVQASSSRLLSIANITPGSNNFLVGVGGVWTSQTPAEVRATLGVSAGGGTVNNDDWSGTDLAIANGGTGASSAAAARANLGAKGDGDTFGSIQMGNADTTLTRKNAGQLATEGACVLSHTNTGYPSGKVTFSTSNPSGGSNGDIWFRY